MFTLNPIYNEESYTIPVLLFMRKSHIQISVSVNGIFSRRDTAVAVVLLLV